MLDIGAEARHDWRMWNVLQISEAADHVVGVLGWVVLPPGRDVDHPGLLIPLPFQGSANVPATFRERLDGEPRVLSGHAWRETEETNAVALAGDEVEGNEL